MVHLSSRSRKMGLGFTIMLQCNQSLFINSALPNSIRPLVTSLRPRDQSPRPPPLTQLKAMEEFRQVRAHLIKLGLDRIPHYADELLSACALSGWGSLGDAPTIFSGLDNPDTFDLNTMIRAHVNYSDPTAAQLLYQEMGEAGVMPDNFTFPFVLKACAQLSGMREGTQIHGHALKFGFRDDVFVQNSLINLYGKCEEIDAACRVFGQMGSHKTLASWSGALAAHNRMELSSERLNTFAAMIRSGLRPDESSLVSVLSSCAHLGALDVGQSIHCSLMRIFTGLNVMVQTSLIDMYVKCGLSEKGLIIFNQMPEKNKWAYRAMISGLATHGDGDKALKIFTRILRDGIEPDEAVCWSTESLHSSRTSRRSSSMLRSNAV